MTYDFQMAFYIKNTDIYVSYNNTQTFYGILNTVVIWTLKKIDGRFTREIKGD